VPQPPSAEPYAYLLGVYLGDGYLARAKRDCFRLVVVNTSCYPRITGEIAAAITAVLPDSAVNIRALPHQRCVNISSYSKRWPELFPQHGPGRKHERKIELADWQRVITTAHPEAFVRGLIHSDGCRFLARQRVKNRTYVYVRYSFSNRSQDIKDLFCEHLERLGIHWTRANRFQIQIARRSSVDRLEELVGPKA
jgi:hypothetical protein